MIETEQRRALKGQGGGAATVGWDNPPIPWDEFERRLTWRARSADPDHNNQAAGRRPVTELHSPPNWSLRRHAEVCGYSPSPITMACTGRLSSPKPRPAAKKPASRWRQSSAPNSAWAPRWHVAASLIRGDVIFSCLPATRKGTGGCAA